MMVKFNELRHTFVALDSCRSEREGGSVRAGHSSVALTLDRYSHLYQDTEDEISQRLDELLNARAARQEADGNQWG